MTSPVTYKHLTAISRWYLAEEPLSIVRGYLAYARAFMEIVPLPFLAMTLLKPWKNIKERKTEHGFNLKVASERLVLNILSRVVGAVVRMIAIALGIAMQCVLLALSLAYLVLWYAYPLLTLAILIILLRSL